VQYELHVALLV